MNILFLFGMGSDPAIGENVLALLIVGLIGFAICYVHRYLIFAVAPIFIWLAYYVVKNTSTGFYSPTQKELDYFLIFLDLLAILFGAFLSWKKHKSQQKILQ